MPFFAHALVRPRMMDLVVLGAGPAYTNRPGAAGSAYLLRYQDRSIVFDLGQGVFPRLAGELDPADLLAVVVSHLHPDHFIDIVPLRHYLYYECRPARRVTVHAAAALEARLDALMGEQGFAGASLDIRALAAGTRSIGPFAVDASLVTHTDESYAVRLSQGSGPGLVYSGDCGVADDLAPLIRPGDTLLVEVSFGVGPVPAGAGHLDAPAIARLVESTGPGEVLLTHLQMGFDPEAAIRVVAEATRAPVRLVEPGDRFELRAT
jgi:ribonuclease BN (tRNA processing enzyme)